MVAGTEQSKPNGSTQWTLSSILDNPDTFELEMTNGDDKMVEEPVEEDKGAEEGYCIECEGEVVEPFTTAPKDCSFKLVVNAIMVDQPANVYCKTCTDDFCDVCFEAQHRKGTRKLHESRPLESFQRTTAPAMTPAQQDVEAEAEAEAEAEGADDDETLEELDIDQPIAESSTAPLKSLLSKRAKHIPLRLTLQERKLL